MDMQTPCSTLFDTSCFGQLLALKSGRPHYS